MVKVGKNVTTFIVQRRCSPRQPQQQSTYSLRDDLKVICDVTSLGSDDASSSLDSSRIAPKLRRAWQWTILVECLLQVLSRLWARNAAIETDWHVVKPGHSARLVDGEGAVFFRVCWIFSPPLILAPLNHSLCRSIPWFPSLCCRLNFCFFHSCFQMVEGSCLQTACRRNLQQLGTFSR